jgi:hypothetical protein
VAGTGDGAGWAGWVTVNATVATASVVTPTVVAARAPSLEASTADSVWAPGVRFGTTILVLNLPARFDLTDDADDGLESQTIWTSARAGKPAPVMVRRVPASPEAGETVSRGPLMAVVAMIGTINAATPRIITPVESQSRRRRG